MSSTASTEPLCSDEEYQSPLTYDNDNQPLEGREYRNSKTAKFAPGEHWDGVIVLLESSAPSRYRQAFLDWTVAAHERSVAASQRKYDATGAYRENRLLVREEQKQATLEKERAIKREMYHADQASKGKTTRRNRDLSGMTEAERLADMKTQNAKRKRDERAKKKAASWPATCR